VSRSRFLFTANRLAFDISKSAIYNQHVILIKCVGGRRTFRFMRAESSRSEVVGRRDLVVLSSSVSEGSDVSGAGVVESDVERSETRGS